MSTSQALRQVVDRDSSYDGDTRNAYATSAAVSRRAETGVPETRVLRIKELRRYMCQRALYAAQS